MIWEDGREKRGDDMGRWQGRIREQDLIFEERRDLILFKI